MSGCRVCDRIALFTTDAVALGTLLGFWTCGLGLAVFLARWPLDPVLRDHWQIPILGVCTVFLIGVILRRLGHGVLSCRHTYLLTSAVLATALSAIHVLIATHPEVIGQIRSREPWKTIELAVAIVMAPVLPPGPSILNPIVQIFWAAVEAVSVVALVRVAWVNR